MRKLLLSLLIVGLVAPGIFAQDETKEEKKPAAKKGVKIKIDDESEPAEEKPISEEEYQAILKKISLVIGHNIGKNIKGQQLEVDLEELTKGIGEALADKELSLGQEEIQEVFGQYEKVQVQRLKVKAEKNKAESEAFLAENGKKEGIKTTKSGLQYKILKEGDGPVPTKNGLVTTHYKGTLLDGTKFDSSYDRKEPAQFPVTGVIAGWTEALLLMPVGSKWQLFVPADLAYGEQGRPGIPPNSLLVFEIELLEVEESKPAKKGGLDLDLDK